MNILHVISSVDMKGGGPIEGVRQLAAAHARVGHATEIACMDAPDTGDAGDFPFPVHRLGPAVTHYKYSQRLLPWLRAHAPRYDAVVVNGLWQYGSFATWKALKDSGTPYFVFTHGMLDPWFKREYPLKHMKKWLFWPWADYRVLRDAAAVLFTCEEERLLARQSFWLYRCNEVVVNLGIAAPPPESEAQRNAFFGRFPGAAGKRVILFLSRIHEKKGCDLLLRAFAAATARHADLHLVMAGPEQGGYGAALRSLAHELGLAERITWTGMLTGASKWGAYRAAEAFILPSHQENFGIVVAEALACGVPVLISNKVNIWREVAEAGAGLVAEDDLKGATALLQRWLALSADERDGYSAHALDCYARHFQIDQAARNVAAAIALGAPSSKQVA
ncbi:MAG TPA: glycosyltransferase [Burkholderiales bacterium]